uniref:WW domain-containing protein n=1 Tax=Spongospora subterranea TaxID=70186 RepID=A0A0H5R5G9_9EUKA|eukprot:CRZ09027.1 hypothetical protein [Spongospora subterranea]
MEVFRLTDKAFVQRLRGLNMITALLFLLAGVLNFVLMGGFSFSQFINSVFVMLFAMLLLLFESHFGWAHTVVANNLALILGWKGRTAFTFFVSSLSLGLGIMGIIASVVGCFDVVVNMFGLIYRKELSPSFDFKHLYQTDPNPTQPLSNEPQIEQPKPYSPSRNANAAPASNDDWEEIIDADTGNKYYMNKANGKTSWSKPN